MSDIEISLVATEARHAASAETDVIERLRKCMKAAQAHFMVTDESKQLMGALAAALRLTEGTEGERLERSIADLGRFNAMLSALQAGVPVDFDSLLAKQEREKEEGFEPIPIMRLWHEAKKAQAAE